MPSDDRPVCLVNGGLLQARIVLPAGADAAAEFAAEELRRHLCALAGLGPQRRAGDAAPTTIFLGDHVAAGAAGIDLTALALGRESFHLATRGGHLHILGGGPRGLLYGVYHLLEALGCRWFTPEHTIIPRRRRIVLPPLNVTQSPAFEFRDTFNSEVRDPLWWVRNRMNGWYCPVPAYMGGHVSYGGFVHTFYGLLPPEEFFAAHPEYYSLVGGARRRDGAQLCLTHPDVLRIVTARVLERMRNTPAATIFSVSQNDCAGPCECPACRAVAAEEGSESGPMLRFVNAVAAVTAQEFPDNLIDTLAYQYTLDAPRHVQPHPNVRVRLCSICCCQGHGYGTCDHPESARFLRALEAWGRRTPQMYIWHYATNFAHYLLPMPDFDELHANLNLYRRHGVYGVFIQSCGEEGGGAESLALRGWLTSRLLWNPDQAVWPRVDEFLPAVYGPAAPHVRRYLDVFHDRVRSDRTLHPSLYDAPTHGLFEAGTLAAADAALAEAEAKARGAGRVRVRLLRHGVRYSRVYVTAGAFRREGDTYRGDATAADRAQFEDLLRDCHRAGIQRLREGAPLAFTAHLIASRLNPHRVEWLRGGGQELAVVPDLGGRLLEWHAHGRQWLAPADPDNAWNLYPMNGGYCEFVILGLYSYCGWAEGYRVARRGEALVLTALVGEGLTLQRTLSLRDGVLRVVSRLANRSGQTRRCGWGASLQLAVPQARAVVPAAGGAKSYAWDEIPDGLGAAVVLAGDQRPAGEWRIEVGGLRLVHRFPAASIERAILGKVGAKGLLALDLRSEGLDLQPGKAMTFVQEFAVEAL